MSRKVGEVNPILNVDPIHVAHLFAVENLVGEAAHNAESILSALRGGDYGGAKRLCDQFSRPEFGSAPDYFARKQFTALVAKVPFKGDTRSRKRRAIDSFMESEARCRRTNKKLRWFNQHPNRVPDDVRVVLSRARNFVRKVLGTLDERVYGAIIAMARPGGGVTIGTRDRHRTGLAHKLGHTDLCVTERAAVYAVDLVEGSPAWLSSCTTIDFESMTATVPYVLVAANRVAFVPKDARTLRTIAVEPHLNVMLQLGVHEYLARRLEYHGNDITDQSRNQRLAREGSLTGETVTLDLASASDTVSTELVRWLLPSEWFGLLDDLRCHSGVVDGDILSYEKFSSMGNGFTFVLETIIFWSLARAVNTLTGGRVASCYGDDIVVDAGSALLLTEVLTWCGFKLNSEKSFVVGRFRESCGADWHHGARVTPQYVRTALFRPTDCYQLLNRLDPIFRVGPIRDYLLRCIREKTRVLYGLANEDTSSCLFTSFEYLRGSGGLKWNRDIQQWTFKRVGFTPSPDRAPRWMLYLAALKGAKGGRRSIVNLFDLDKETHVAQRGRGKYRLMSGTAGVTRDVPVFPG